MKTFLIFLLFNFLWISMKTSDIENRLITDETQMGSYNQLSNTETDNDESVEIDRFWKIPRAQYDVGVPIYGTIFGFMTSWGQDDPISLFIRAIYIMSFLVCVQIYFGFYLGCYRNPEACCSYIPRVNYVKIPFTSGPLDVSFGRWISGPFSWITAAISFLPNDAYSYLEDNAYFPQRTIIHLIFMVQLLYFFGMYDCYRSNVMQAE